MAHFSDHLSDKSTSPEIKRLTAQNHALQQRITALEAQLQATKQPAREGIDHGGAVATSPSEDLLHHAHKMEVLGTFTAGIVHDFNNVLSIMLGYADLTMYDLPQGSVAQCTEICRREGGQDLIQQMPGFYLMTVVQPPECPIW